MGRSTSELFSFRVTVQKEADILTGEVDVIDVYILRCHEDERFLTQCSSVERKSLLHETANEQMCRLS